MALYKLEELVASQLSMDLKQQVFALLYNSPAARGVKLAGQISDAVSSLASDTVLGGLYFSLRRPAEARRRRQAEAKRSRKAAPARPRPPRPRNPRPHRPHRPR